MSHRLIYFAKINENTIPLFNKVKLLPKPILYKKNLSELMHDANIASDSINIRSLRKNARFSTSNNIFLKTLKHFCTKKSFLKNLRQTME